MNIKEITGLSIIRSAGLGMRRMPLLLALLAALLLTGCGGEQRQAFTPEVAVTTLKTEKVTLKVELPGRTSAYLMSEVRPQVGGIIKKRYFTEGGNVKAGQVLYQIDPSTYQAAYDSAKASLARAEANLATTRLKAARYKDLIAIKAISRQEYDDIVAAHKQAEADVASGKAAVENARINLAYTRVTAPISGRIGKSSVTDGALVTASQPAALAVIQQLDPMYVDVTQASSELLRLKDDMAKGKIKSGANQAKVRLIQENGSVYPETGVLKFSDVTVDQTTGSVIVRTVFPNKKNILLPGMFVQAVVEEGETDKAILVPQQAVYRDLKGNAMVMLVDASDKVEQRTIRVGQTFGDKWLVVEGLKEGERVIMEGRIKVKPGMTVKVVPFEEQKPAADVRAAERSETKKDGGK
jgi:membrane fusion protein (multidrug efflux system)